MIESTTYAHLLLDALDIPRAGPFAPLSIGDRVSILEARYTSLREAYQKAPESREAKESRRACVGGRGELMGYNFDIPYNFGALPPLPEGYRVLWFGGHEHYQAVGPDDWESPISCDPYHCRRWAIAHAREQACLDAMREE